MVEGEHEKCEVRSGQVECGRSRDEEERRAGQDSGCTAEAVVLLSFNSSAEK